MLRAIIRSNRADLPFGAERVPHDQRNADVQIAGEVEPVCTPAGAGAGNAPRTAGDSSYAAGAAAGAPYAVTVMLSVAGRDVSSVVVGDDLESVVGLWLSDARCVGVRVRRLAHGGDPAAVHSRAAWAALSLPPSGRSCSAAVREAAGNFLER